jgi:hypothetical protein
MSFIRNILGPGQHEVWSRFCTQYGADYEVGGLLRRPRVRKRIGNWTVTLTAGKSPGPAAGTRLTTTTLRTPFVTKDGFRFTIERKSGAGMYGKPVGRHFITCGDPEFDRHFWINSKDEGKARALLLDPDYRRVLSAQPVVWLKVKDTAGWFGPKFPENVDMLIYEQIEMKPITDVAQLASLFDMIEATLRRLCQIGSAGEDDPGIVI